MLHQILQCLEDHKDQGRAACVNRQLYQAVAPLAPALYHFSLRGWASRVRKLLGTSAAREGINAGHGEEMYTALHVAASSGHNRVVSTLLAAGAALEAENKGGWRALHIAAQNGHARTVEALLAAGAALEAEAKDGVRALHFAAMDGHAPAVESLVEAGAELEAETKHGWRALHFTAQNGHALIVEEAWLAGASYRSQEWP